MTDEDVELQPPDIPVKKIHFSISCSVVSFVVLNSGPKEETSKVC